MSLLTAIFGKARIVWGDRWTAHLTANPEAALQEWLAATNDLTEKQIVKGFQEARNLCEYPPSLAAFRKLALNIPSAESAFLKAVQGDRKYRQFLEPWYWREDNKLYFGELKSLFLESYREHIKSSLQISV